MAKISQYFASGKLTPSTEGTQAWEQAGRRLGPLFEQQATGARELGRDIAALWDTTGRLEGQLYEHSGGGGSARGGSVQTPISFGRNPSEPATPYTNPQQYNVFDAKTHSEISRAAPAVAQTATALTSAISPPPEAGGGVTILSGNGRAAQTVDPNAGNTITVLSGNGRAPQTIDPPDMQRPGTVNVLRGGQAPQQVLSWPGLGHQVMLPPGVSTNQLGPKVIQESPASDLTGPSTDPSVLAARAANDQSSGRSAATQVVSGATATGMPASATPQPDVSPGVVPGAQPQNAPKSSNFTTQYGPLILNPPAAPVSSSWGSAIWSGITNSLEDAAGIANLAPSVSSGSGSGDVTGSNNPLE